MWDRKQTFEIVNLVGSIASTLGFAILIVSWFSSSSDRDAETILWQYVLLAIALIASVGIFVFCGIWIVNGLSKYPANSGAGVVVIGVKLCLGLLALGIAGDGMIAAIHWRVWPHIPISFISFWVSAIFR